MKPIVFWGAGKIGKRILDLWRRFGVQPDFFADNSVELWGTEYYGIKILSVEELVALGDCFVIITCKQEEDIRKQLLRNKIKAENIICFKREKDVLEKEVLLFFMLNMQGRLRWNENQESKNLSEKEEACILFELQGGFILGGVETWSVQEAEKLRLKGKRVKFVTTDISGYKGNHAEDELILLEWQDNPFSLDGLEKRLAEYQKNLPCNIICNFPRYTFIAACMAKTIWPQDVNLIAVIHNDEQVYYDTYGEMKTVIDRCLVISSKIKDTVLQGGFSEKKIEMLSWSIPCNTELTHVYSEKNHPIHIGYAGRVTLLQKRMDLLFETAKKLKESEIDFVLEIAGTGDYLPTLKKCIDEENLQKKIKLLGHIPNEEISGFWSRQDIVIGCSDFEGRSISQAEAMAAGAVPVITDTSGARDYVEDGYNGYIVPTEDVDAVVDRISYLYGHRDLIRLMGSRSHQRIVEQNRENEQDILWDKVLKR